MTKRWTVSQPIQTRSFQLTLSVDDMFASGWCCHENLVLSELFPTSRCCDSNAGRDPSSPGGLGFCASLPLVGQYLGPRNHAGWMGTTSLGNGSFHQSCNTELGIEHQCVSV